MWTYGLVLLNEYMHGADVHTNNGKLIAQALGVNWKNLTPEECAVYRNKSKGSLSFGVVFGMGARSLAELLGVSEDDAEALIMTIFNKYKIVDQWIKRMHAAALKTGFVKTLFGRRRDIPQILSSDRGKMNYGLRQSINSCIQGTAADLMKMGMLEIQKNKRLVELGYEMLMSVHDEVCGEVPEENAAEANEIIKQCMSEFPTMKKLGIPFPTEGGYAKNWYAAKEQKM